MEDLYSIRNKQPSSVFNYDTIPQKLKVQIVHVWNNFFKQIYQAGEIWDFIHQTICEAHGEHELIGRHYFHSSSNYKVCQYFEKTDDLEKNLDVIEIVSRIIIKVPHVFSAHNLSYSADTAIGDINTRFLQNDVGYAFQQNQILKIGNKVLHDGITNSTLKLISNPTYTNVNEEFLNAHKHFKDGRYKESLVDCLKAMESTLKIICTENAWAYNSNATASKLIDICFSKKLIPDYLQTHFAGLRSTLEAGVPVVRNRLGGHGQGPEKIEVPEHYVSYMLYMAGNTINFLISCQSDFKRKPN